MQNGESPSPGLHPSQEKETGCGVSVLLIRRGVCWPAAQLSFSKQIVQKDCDHLLQRGSEIIYSSNVIACHRKESVPAAQSLGNIILLSSIINLFDEEQAIKCAELS